MSGIIVKEIPQGLDSEVIKQYFFSRGGEIRTYRYYAEEKKVFLEFEDPEVAAGMLSATHKIGRHVVTIISMDEEKYAKNGVETMQESTETTQGDVATVKNSHENYEHNPRSPVQHVARVEYELPHWKVLSASSDLLQAIESQAIMLGVKLIHPNTKASIPVIEVQGSASGIVQIVQQLEDLKLLIHVSSKVLKYTPGLWTVLQSMEDKIRILEHDCNVAVSIAATAHNDDVDAEIYQVPLTAVFNHCYIEVCIGNFTQHPSATSIVNIMSQDLDQQYLSQLVQSGGRRIYEDVMSRMKELSSCELPQVFETNPHNIKINKLVHCVVLKWNGGKGNEVQVLEEGLNHAILSAALPCIVIALPSLPPILYPPVVVVEALINVIERISLDVSGVTFAFYAATTDDVKAVETFFNEKSIESQVKTAYQQMEASKVHDFTDSRVIRVLKSTLPSFISVIKGDLFQQKVQAYVNSTNSDLDLSRGMLSQQLLKRMGQKLQEQCKEYVPLSTGQVAVTSAENMYSDIILHVVLPAYKSTESERALRETIRNILQVCLKQNITSIAIPSLGTGKLGYPHHVVADILFAEILVFNETYPDYFKQMVFVLSKKEIYESFMKVYVKQLCLYNEKSVAKKNNVEKPGMSTQLVLQHGSIEDECVDVIVNPTTVNADLSSNPVSQAISKKAGESLLAMCCQLRDSGVLIHEKSSVFTNASGQLRSKKLLHVYSPTRGECDESDVNSIIYSVVLDTLAQVEKAKYRSLSLPLLGFGYPVEGRANAVIEAALEFGQSAPISLKEIGLVVLNKCHYEKVCSCFNAISARYRGQSDSLGPEGKHYVLELQLCSPLTSKQMHQSHHPWNVTNLEMLESSDALIEVYGIVPEQGDVVSREIENKVLRQLITECIDDDQIQYLISSEVADIKCKLKKLGVGIVLKKEEKKMLLLGEKNSVRDAQALVATVLNSLQHAQVLLNQVIWLRESETGVHLFPHEVSSRLEIALMKKVHWLEMHSGMVNTVIDLDRMLETDLCSGETCCIRRVDKKSYIDFPQYWQLQPIEHGQEKACHMFNVAINTEEFHSAVKEFKETMHDLKFSIISLERVQNINEYTKHCAFLDVLRRRHSEQVLLKRLFHGTSPHSVQSIAHQGFNRIFAADANAAVFGKGVYFASRANYSAQEKYAVPDQYGNQRIFICQVAVGKFTKGEKTMKIAPPLDASKNKHLLFDTLVDDPVKPTIYVAMSDSQAYPEYLITFRRR